MEKIEWNPSFSVGVKQLDGQHENIVRTINLLLSEPGVTVRSETISEILDRLTKYASEHFRAEEQLLEEYGYPELAGHKEEHKAYRLKIVRLCQATISHEDSVPAELLDFLREWWVHHILETDMQFRPIITARGAK